MQTPPEVFVAYGTRGEVDVFELGTTSPSRSLSRMGHVVKLTFLNSVQQVLRGRYGLHCQTPSRTCKLDDLRNVTTALTVCTDTGFVYTGDTEGSLRRWNLGRAPLCDYISGPREITARSPYRIAYNEMTGADGQPTTIYEMRVPNEQTKVRTFPEMRNYASTRHRCSISDVLSLHSDILVSAGSDGVIKIWK
ncbi:hypothetical protein COOONC_01385 [Cooperia oncophora]